MTRRSVGGQSFKIGPNQYLQPIALYAAKIPGLVSIRSVTAINWSSNYTLFVFLHDPQCNGMPEMAIGGDSGLTLPCDTLGIGVFIGFTQNVAPMEDGYMWIHLDSEPLSASLIQVAPGTPAGNAVRRQSSWKQK
jgi:hypothetical protein